MAVPTRPAAVDPPRLSAHAPFAERVPVYLLVGLFLVFVVRTAVITDDAYITFRTVENFVAGRGLTWNPGERVQAYTHPLWMFLLSAAFATTRELYYTAIALSIGISLAAIGLLVRTLASSTFAAVLAVGVLAFSKAYVDFSTSGLENPLTHLLLFAFLALWLNCDPRRAPILPMALLTSALLLNRLDCALLAGPPLIAALAANRSIRGLGLALIGLSPLVAWELFSTLYYGFPFPNTAYAKLNSGIPIAALVEQGCFYLVNSVREDAVTCLGIFAGLTVACQRRIDAVAVGIGILLHIAYVVAIGGDFMSGRMLTPALAAAVAVLASAPIPPRAAYLGLAIVVIAATTAPHGAFRSVLEAGYFHIDERGIADERSWYGPFAGLAEKAAGQISDEHLGVKQARAARQSKARVVVGENAGFLGYYAADAVHVVDAAALGDALLARLPPRPSARWRVGHLSRDLPAGYRESLESGTNQLVDAGLRAYYERMRKVIRGPLLERERLWEIIRFNLGENDSLLEPYAASVRDLKSQ